MTSALIAILLVGVLFEGIDNLFTRVYYAQGNTKTPLLISLTGFCVTCVLLVSIMLSPRNTLTTGLAHILRLFTTENTEIVLLAFAYTIGSIVSSFLFLSFYQKDHQHRIIPFFIKNFFISVGHAVVLVILSKVCLSLFEVFGQMKTVFGILIQAGMSGLFAILFWFVYLILIKNEHALFITTRIQKFFSTHTVILEETQN